MVDPVDQVSEFGEIVQRHTASLKELDADGNRQKNGQER